VKNLIPTAASSSILVDFEKAAMNTFSAAYTTATLRGCYFHLCQIVMGKVSGIGLKAEYENNEDTRTFIRCLPALAFVPPQNVPEAFDLLADSMPQCIDRIDEAVTYFEHTYILCRRLRGRGDNYREAVFPIELWNQHAAGLDGIA